MSENFNQARMMVGAKKALLAQGLPSDTSELKLLGEMAFEALPCVTHTNIHVDEDAVR